MNLLLVGIEGPEVSAAERRLVADLQPAGFILFRRNLIDPPQTRALIDSLRELCGHEPIVSIDQEGGRVVRTDGFAPEIPSAPELAADAQPNRIARCACATADQLRLLGFNLDFAPVVDLDHFPGEANALRGRSWGSDAQRVIDHAGMWNRWLRKRGVHGCAKHFPAGGRARSDPHHDLPSSDAGWETLQASDVLPYTALMPELDAVMVGHVVFPALDPDLPASLSPRVVRDKLRMQLGFDDHLVLTDDLDMDAIRDHFPSPRDAALAIEAGNDLAMICHDTGRADSAAKAIAALPSPLLHDAHKRVERFLRRLHPPPRWSDGEWDKACREMESLRQEVPRLGADAAEAGSPVGDY